VAYATVTLTGQFLTPSGQGIGGTIRIEPSVPWVIDATGNKILVGTVSAKLGDSGAFSIALPATDDVTLSPSGFQYTLHGPTGSITFSLPTTPSTVDVADITPVAPAPVAAANLTDATVKALVDNAGSGVRASLSATYVARGNRVIDLCQGPYNATPGQDITTALQSAITALAAVGGGEIFFSQVGTYLLNGAPQTGSALGYSYNGQVLFPAVAWDGLANTPIRIRGAIGASSGAPSTGQANGVIIQSNASGAYMFDSVPYSDKWGWHWTGIMPIFENVILRSPAGGTAGGINALCTLRARFERVTVDTPNSPGSQPSGTLTGIVGPHGLSNGDVTFRDVSIRGLYTAIRTTEHGVYDNIEIIGCENAFEIGENSHSIWFGYVDVEQCHSVFKVPSGAIGAVYGHLDVEMSGVSEGAWNSPLHLVAPGSVSSLTGALNIRIVGSPAGGLALGASAYNLDTALLYDSTGDRGGLSGWRSKHPSDNFVRLNSLNLPAGNGGQCWPSLHPWRNVSNSVTVTGGQVKGTSSGGNSQIVVPTWRNGVSRRVSLTTTLAASGYNAHVIAHRVNGGANAGNSIQWKASGGNLTLSIAGTTVVTVGGISGSTTYTLAVDVIYGADKQPSVIRGYKDGVLQASHTLTTAEVALLVPDTTTYPYMEDGLGFGADTTSYGTSFVVTDIPATTPTLMGVKANRSAAFSVNNTTFTDVQWDNELWDTNAFHDNTTNPERVTIPAGCGGYYLINAEWGTGSPAPAAGRVMMRITVNGTELPGGSAEGGSASVYTSLNASTVALLVPGDIVRVSMYQSTGATINADVARCGLSLTKIAD